ncbi:hypothetical protein DPEC_G00182100 [Dallia pectoralis]|uniref:Uncharacterized protein n=1 Tax=Dallia pectoralis TaxID=75939 RepID=A0ACC2GAD1_DALPE|nr:hypothetical protein DPEC_G00182100 [Dallia pectoralis]
MTRDKTLTFAVMFFIHVWTFRVDSKTIGLPLRGLVNNTAINDDAPDKAFPLGMAGNTVDDFSKDSRSKRPKKVSPVRCHHRNTIALSMVQDSVDDISKVLPHIGEPRKGGVDSTL